VERSGSRGERKTLYFSERMAEKELLKAWKKEQRVTVELNDLPIPRPVGNGLRKMKRDCDRGECKPSPEIERKELSFEKRCE